MHKKLNPKCFAFYNIVMVITTEQYKTIRLTDYCRNHRRVQMRKKVEINKKN